MDVNIGNISEGFCILKKYANKDTYVGVGVETIYVCGIDFNTISRLDKQKLIDNQWGHDEEWIWICP